MGAQVARPHGRYFLAVDVVAADGERLRASEDEHPDLFWALRGANFGVAIQDIRVLDAFQLRIHEQHQRVERLAWPRHAHGRAWPT